MTRLLFFIVVLGTTDGLNCYGHICSGTEYCLIQIHSGIGVCHQGHTHPERHQVCLGAYHPGDHCYCHEQTCVDSMARRATTAAQTVGQVQTTVSPRIEVFSCFKISCATPKACRVTFFNDVPISGSCEIPQPNAKSCIPFPANGDCNCFSRLCTGIIDTLTTQSTTQGQLTTTGLPSTDGTTPLTLCSNHEDVTFNCQDYNNHYGLCASLTPMLQTIARTRCPKFCNLCGSNGTVPTQSALTGSTSLPPCVDHDNRCSQTSYKTLLCNPNTLPDTQKYAIQTCPLTCNYCAEYLAGFTPTLTTGPPCEDKMNCTILVASNMCNVPTVKNLCAKSCNQCLHGIL